MSEVPWTRKTYRMNGSQEEREFVGERIKYWMERGANYTQASSQAWGEWFAKRDETD